MAIEHSHQNIAPGGLTLDQQARKALTQSVRGSVLVQAKMVSIRRDTSGTG